MPNSKLRTTSGALPIKQPTISAAPNGVGVKWPKKNRLTTLLMPHVYDGFRPLILPQIKV